MNGPRPGPAFGPTAGPSVGQPAADKPLDEAAQRLVRHLDKSLDGHRASGDAFVASVYGEWGIGKTFALKSVHEVYDRRLRAQLAELSPATARLPLVVPVWFAPWRYEHEEHLVVPMLKTIEYTLAQVADRVGPVQQAVQDQAAGRDDFIQRNEALGHALKGGARTVGRLAQALLSAVKFKAAPLGVGVDIDPRAAIEQSQKLARPPEAPADKPAAPAALGESIYFDAQAQLESLTQPQDAVPLRLVVMVDDLDRCLPEKAVQVLESVKLFLNVPGFSFVLAVDDEVVERGIAHRYRDYRLADRDGAFADDVPISGTQYLEKIVHLPVHLPRWTREKARGFLQVSYPLLYGSSDEATAPSLGEKLSAEADGRPARRSGSTADQALAATLELVLGAVPLVPRKLIRLSEGVEFLRAQFAETGQLAHWSALHAVRVVGLQQLHPTLYRYVRQRPGRYWRLFDLLRDAWGEPRYRDGEDLPTLFRQFGDRVAPVADTAPATAAQRQEQVTRREQLALLQTVQHSGSQRGAGDPVDFFLATAGTLPPEASDLGLSQQAFCDLYFGGEAPASAAAASAAASVTSASDDPMVESSIADVNAAAAALLSPDAVSRREFIEGQSLAGKRLPTAVFAALCQRLADEATAAPLVQDLRWLRDMAQVTSAPQLLGVYAAGRVVDRFTDGLPALEGS